MPRYNVTVGYTQQRQKALTVYARDDDEAMQKAEDIISKWDGVESCEAIDCARED